MELRKKVLATLDELGVMRRSLHRIPERGLEEYKTQEYIFNYLSSLAPDSLEKIAPTGIKAVFRAKNNSLGRTTAFRADIDALEMEECTGVDFASEHKGFMHACGHDAHASVALMLAKLVSQARACLKEDVVIIFQPGEEGLSGAKKMVEGGVLENPHVDRIYGLHVTPGIPVGSIGICPGTATAISDNFDIWVHGRSAHAAHPENGSDAIVAAAELINILQTLVSRIAAPSDGLVFTIGTIHGGNRRNIICESVVMECTLRAYSNELRQILDRHVREMLHGMDEAFHTRTEFIPKQFYPCVDNDAQLASEFSTLIGSAAHNIARQSISEDFSEYQLHTRGLFLFLGIGDTTALHTDTLMFDEEALLYALEAYLRILGL